jgi:hypothetical protein
MSTLAIPAQHLDRIAIRVALMTTCNPDAWVSPILGARSFDIVRVACQVVKGRVNGEVVLLFS